ncbi:AAA family ATPase [Flexivirga sp. B27]
MRLHRLRLQAFGPFAGTESIDFDSLTAGGLHLIHGPTGAGKTSILDAICFALFAGVPGGRMQGRDTLHSDHAAATDRPEVELEFGVGGRRLRLRRSPEHQVAKKRGSGTRTQRGSVVLEERGSAGWETVSTRNDEVAQAIGDLLGMGLTQFAQVMLLPQGEFTAFLRAKPDDRGKLLERLFDISDFAAVEQWLLDHRKSLEAKDIQARADRAMLISRARETLGEVVTQDPAAEASWELDDDAESLPVLHGLTERLSDQLTEALTVADDTAGALERLRSQLAAQRSLAKLQGLARGARRTLEQVAAQAPELADAEESLAAAARAQRCAPAVAADERRRHTHEQARRVVADHRAGLARVSNWSVPEPHAAHGLSETALAPLVERAAAGTEALAGQPELLRQVRVLDAEVQSATADLAAARTDADHRRSALDAADTQLTQLEERRSALQPDATSHAEWQRLLVDIDQAAESLHDAARNVDAAQRSEREHRRKQRAWAAAEAEVLRLRNARLTGIAAELASDLEDEIPCPVCGSTDHPAPAASADNQVDADQVDAAEDNARTAAEQAAAVGAAWSAHVGRAQVTCRAAVDALARVSPDSTEERGTDDQDTDAVAAVRAELANDVEPDRHLMTAALGDVPETSGPSDEGGVPSAGFDQALAGALVSLAERVAAAREVVGDHVARGAEAVQQLQLLDDQCLAFRAERDRAQQAGADAAEAVRLGEARLASLEAQIEAAMSRLAEIARAHQTSCGCSPALDLADPDVADPDAAAPDATALGALAETASIHAACVEHLDRLRAAATAEHTAAAEVDSAGHELAELLAECGFDDAAAVSQATLSEAEQQKLRSFSASVRTEEAKATGVLEQSDVAAAEAAAPATVDELTGQVAVAERTARTARDAVGDLRRAHERLQQIATELAAHDDRTAPLQQQLATATSLAAAVAGAGDNTMRMRLTAYVLAARLESVTTLANERLQSMTDGRYQLEHTDERAARGSKSGLGLRVRDAWTGTTRDTSTLSGGESFIASLALALGLGDAVLEAAGGRRLETLLVDEGFGSLDEDSLEQVLDVLDGLRAGGRNVGIVSHVPELRTRIPAQIRVCKTARGSTLEIQSPGQVA